MTGYAVAAVLAVAKVPSGYLKGLDRDLRGQALFSSPDRIRTGVTALRGRRPRPLDDGAVHVRRQDTLPPRPR